MSTTNYITEYIVEPAAAVELEEMLGEEKFNSLARFVENLDADSQTVADTNILDGFFPIDDAQGLLEYVKAYAALMEASTELEEVLN